MESLEKAQYDNEQLWKHLNVSESNKERTKEISEMIPDDVNSLADIGCGNGMFLNYIKSTLDIKDLIGIDISEVALKGVKTDKKVGSILDIPLGSKEYDIVTALEVLEHLNEKDFEKGKEELCRVSSKYVLVSTPFEEDLELEFVKCPKCKTRYNVSHHKRCFSENDIKDLFKEYGFECVNVKYVSKRNEYLILSNAIRRYRKYRGIRKSDRTVCPVCGFKESNVKTNGVDSEKKKSYISVFKNIWPKRYRYKWVVGIYKIRK